MRDDLFAPCVGVAAVVPHAGVVVDHGTVEVQQEQIGRDGIGQRGAVVALVFVVPVLHRVVVRERERDRVDALIHLHEFMCIGTDRRDIVFHRKIDIGSTDAVFCFGDETPHHNILPLAGEPSATAEFREFECVGPVVHRTDLRVQPLLGRFPQFFVIILHPEIDLVDNLEQIDLKLHRGKERAVHNDAQFSVFVQLRRHIVTDRMPQPQEFDIIVFDKANGAQVVKLLLLEAKCAEMVDLLVDLLHHLRRKDDTLAPAFEVILAAEISVLVENDLIHVELIQIRVQQRNHDRFQLHKNLPFIFQFPF